MDSELSARTAALSEVVREVERHVSAQGWDGPVVVYALVRSADLLASSPEMAAELPDDAATDPEHLTAIIQEGLPEADTLEDLLAQLAWPQTVDGTAIVVERIVVPPEAEAGMPTDSDAAVEYLMSHPDRQDVRIAAGVLRSGESWCALRSRTNDTDDAVGGGPEAVPGLVDALAATLR
ncbi:PPA1309 family protein [Ruania albidiflava]|uniref:PPA1309 family protein n=1 Tax=Ruania albidiflava TaxID=366586 RepID=UPI0003B69727|nr:PPA1309 family protein [Ruania albidiflava]